MGTQLTKRPSVGAASWQDRGRQRMKSGMKLQPHQGAHLHTEGDLGVACAGDTQDLSELMSVDKNVCVSLTRVPPLPLAPHSGLLTSQAGHTP